MFDAALIHTIFVWSAWIGGGITVINLLTLIFGGDTDVDVDMDADFDADIEGEGGELKLLTMHGFGGFFLMLGIMGLVLLSYNYSPFISSLVSLLAGFIMMVISAFLFKQARKLNSSGNINIKDAIGKVGTVYITPSKTDPGRIKVVIHNSIKLYDAVPQNNEEFKFNEEVNIVGNVGNKLIITK